MTIYGFIPASALQAQYRLRLIAWTDRCSSRGQQRFDFLYPLEWPATAAAADSTSRDKLGLRAKRRPGTLHSYRRRRYLSAGVPTARLVAPLVIPLSLIRPPTTSCVCARLRTSHHSPASHLYIDRVGVVCVRFQPMLPHTSCPPFYSRLSVCRFARYFSLQIRSVSCFSGRAQVGRLTSWQPR